MKKKIIYVVVENGLVSVYADKGMDINVEVLDMDNYDLEEDEEKERDKMYDKLNDTDYDVLY